MKTNKIHNNLVSWGCMINSDKWQKSILILVSKMHIPFLFVEMVQCFLLGFSCSKILLFQEKRLKQVSVKEVVESYGFHFLPLRKLSNHDAKGLLRIVFMQKIGTYMKPKKYANKILQKTLIF